MDKSTKRLIELLDHSGAKLHRLLARITLRPDVADDLLQEVFLKLQATQTFHKLGNPSGYLFRTAINMAFDWRRSQSGKKHRSIDVELIEVIGSDPAVSLIHREEVEQILSAMQELSETDRELLVMRYIEGMSPDEIAVAWGRTGHQIRAICSKAISRLRHIVARSECSLGSPETTDVQA